MTASSEASDTSGSTHPGLLVRCLHLAVIWAFAAVQPTFDLLSSGEVFALFRLSPIEIVAFSTALLLLPVLVLGLIEWLSGLKSSALRWKLHLLFVGVFMAFFAGHLIKEADSEAGYAVFLLCVPVAVLGAALYARHAPVRSFFSVLSVAPPVFLVLFLLNTPIKFLVNPAEPTSADTEPDGTPVVVIVFDEFPLLSLVDRDGDIDAKSYPGFERLRRTSTWYPHATAISDFTHRALPAMLGGAMPDEERPPSWRAFPDTILATSGKTSTHEYFPMCDPARCNAESTADTDGGLLGFLPNLARVTANTFAPAEAVNRLPQPKEAAASSTVDGFGQIASELEGDDPASVVLVHELLPHSGLTALLPSGKTFTPTATCCLDDLLPDVGEIPRLGVRVFKSDRLTENRSVVAGAKQALLLRVGYADRVIQGLIADLKDIGLYDEAMVVVTADHGASLTAGTSFRRLTSENVAEILRVPLFVKYPGQKGGQVNRWDVQTFDIAPTIAEVLGTELGEAIEAVSLKDPGSDRDLLAVFRAIDGDVYEVEPAEVAERFDALASQQDRLFGPGEKGLQVFSMGPAPDLHGTLPIVGVQATDALATIDSPEIYDDVDLSLDTLPIQVSGTIEGPEREDVKAVAVAVNGEIAATRWTYPSADGTRFEVLVPPRVLRSGKNDVEVYALDPSSDRLTEIGSR